MTTRNQGTLICMNSKCRAEFLIVKKSMLRESNARCFCGSEMKQAYYPPELRVLNDGERAEVEGTLLLRKHSILN